MSVEVLDEDPDDEWALSGWVEMMAGSKPGGAAVLSQQQQQTTEIIWVPANQARSCARQIAGYSYSDNEAKKLRRPEVPIQHPWWPGLWADSVSVEFRHPIGNPDEPFLDENGVEVAGQYLPKVSGIAGAKYGPSMTGKYGWAAVAVQFRHYRWSVFVDGDTAWDPATDFEWRRMVVDTRCDPKLDLIETSGTDTGKLYWAETDAGGSLSPTAGPGPPGTSTDGSVYIRKQITGYEICWRAVEQQFLTGQYPTDIEKGILLPHYRRLDYYLGTVNSTEFMGLPAGTLMFTGYKVVPYPFVGVRTNYDWGLIGCDVFLSFEKLDPPRPANLLDHTGAAIGTPKRGWQTFPYRPNPNGYWFTATAGTTGGGGTAGTYSGNFIALERDLYNIFLHPDDPAAPLP